MGIETRRTNDILPFLRSELPDILQGHSRNVAPLLHGLSFFGKSTTGEKSRFFSICGLSWSLSFMSWSGRIKPLGKASSGGSFLVPKSSKVPENVFLTYI